MAECMVAQAWLSFCHQESAVNKTGTGEEPLPMPDITYVFVVKQRYKFHPEMKKLCHLEATGGSYELTACKDQPE